MGAPESGSTLMWRIHLPPREYAECYLYRGPGPGYGFFVLRNRTTVIAETHEQLRSATERTTEILHSYLELGWRDVTPGD